MEVQRSSTRLSSSRLSLKVVGLILFVALPSLCCAKGPLLGSWLDLGVWFPLYFLPATAIEVYVLRRWFGASSMQVLPTIIAANVVGGCIGIYASNEIAMYSSYDAGHHDVVQPFLYDLSYLAKPFFLFVVLQLLIKWPFYAYALKRKISDFVLVKAAVIGNLVPPIATISLFLMIWTPIWLLSG